MVRVGSCHPKNFAFVFIYFQIYHLFKKFSVCAQENDGIEDIEVDFTANMPICSTETSSGSNTDLEKCNCKEGWYGTGCQICTTDDACKLFHGNSDNYYCDDSLDIKEALKGSCFVGTEDVNNLMEGQGHITLDYDVSSTNLTYALLREDLEDGSYNEMFSCIGSSCSFIEDKNSGEYELSCTSGSCELTCIQDVDFRCGPGLANIVSQLGLSGVTLTCKADATQCTVHERILDFLSDNLGIALEECEIGSCSRKDSSSAVIAGTTSYSAVSNAVFDPSIILEAKIVKALSAILGSIIFFVTIVALVIYNKVSSLSKYDNCVEFCSKFPSLSKIPKLSSYMKEEAQGQAMNQLTTNQGASVGINLKPPLPPMPKPTISKINSTLINKDDNTSSIVFEDIKYYLKGKEIIKGVSGIVHHSKLLAIMGGSGAGKSTLLDILSMRNKSGDIRGNIYHHNRPITKTYKSQIGFVDQHDTLMPTITVLESLLFSAMLRLPSKMSLEEKLQRCLNILSDLQITHIADSFVGNEEKRGISGGEKRRVSVGMELITSPQALFLDEPTSGLDTFNADLLANILYNLSRNRGTAIALTIHQPRSEIFNKFDHLLLMQQGQTVYYGSIEDLDAYFDSIKRPIPTNMNKADFVVDLLFNSADDDEFQNDEKNILPWASRRTSSFQQLNLVSPRSKAHRQMQSSIGWQSINLEDDYDDSTSSGMIELKKGSPKNETILSTVNREELNGKHKPKIGAVLSTNESTYDLHTQNIIRLSKMYSESQLYSSTRKIVDALKLSSDKKTVGYINQGHRSQTSSIAEVLKEIEKDKSSSFIVQYFVLSHRMLLDTIRRKSILYAHLGSFTYFGIVLGFLYFDLSWNGIGAVQNRSGLFLLECIFVAFTSISALPLFWGERALYIHEKSNRYYSSLSYFVAKTFSDLIPYRIFPPLIMAVLTSYMSNLEGGERFFIYALVLVLVSIIAATINTTIGMLTKNFMSGLLIAAITIIHFLVLTTLFINFDSMKIQAFRFLKYVSFFNFGYSALVDNEITGNLVIGDLEIPTTAGSKIIEKLGFTPDTKWLYCCILFAYFAITLAISYYVLVQKVKEKR